MKQCKLVVHLLVLSTGVVDGLSVADLEVVVVLARERDVDADEVDVEAGVEDEEDAVEDVLVDPRREGEVEDGHVPRQRDQHQGDDAVA